MGNTGSQKKFKYGPLGHTVNLASRVEGATKHLGVGLLITGSTRERLGPTFATRRLCRARVVGIAGEVDLHELHAESESSEWQSRRETYERALALYETGKWSEACQALFPLLRRRRGDLRPAEPDAPGPGGRMHQGPAVALRPGPRAQVQVSIESARASTIVPSILYSHSC